MSPGKRNTKLKTGKLRAKASGLIDKNRKKLNSFVDTFFCLICLLTYLYLPYLPTYLSYLPTYLSYLPTYLPTYGYLPTVPTYLPTYLTSNKTTAPLLSAKYSYTNNNIYKFIHTACFLDWPDAFKSFNCFSCKEKKL